MDPSSSSNAAAAALRAESRLPDSPAAESDACWSRIGVYGNGSCTELREFVHCRNCPVYSRAGVQLLNRALPPEYRREWTEHYAVERKLGAPGKTSALLFRISKEWLALPTRAFEEVAERRSIHSLPHRRQGMVLGLANIRGELVVCVSLGRMLGIERGATQRTPRTMYDRLLVANWDGQRVAFPVDEVHGIWRFEPHQLKPTPATISLSNQTCSRGILHWQERAVGYLDAEVLFSTLNRSLT